MDKLLLGNRIKEARIARGYTLDMLAEAVGLNKSTISRYERGEIEMPKLPVIEAIGRKLHTNPSWLIGISTDRTYTPPHSGTTVYSPCNLFGPIKTLRNARGLSSEEVAYQIGISNEDYLAIENGCNTDCITLARLANFYCCSTDFALSFDGVLNESNRLSFTKDRLFRLHRSFEQISPDLQELVIRYAESLQKKQLDPNAEKLTTIRFAARNGNAIELQATELQSFAVQYLLDQMPDVPDDL